MLNPNTPHMYLSEKFTQSTFSEMSPDKMYAFFASPDSGKTTMIIKSLQPHLIDQNKTALYLTSRKSTLEQFKSKVDRNLLHVAHTNGWKIN